jgi:putative DNA primase/helicase
MGRYGEEALARVLLDNGRSRDESGAWHNPAGPGGNGTARPRPERPAAPDVVERARLYLKEMPVSVSGNNGHGALWDAALHVYRGFRLSRDQARQILREFSAACQPPWGDREIEHKLDQVENNAKVPWGFIGDRDDGRRKGQRHDGGNHAGNGTPPKAAPAHARQAAEGEHLTDLGNARRVVKDHGADLHYCHPWKSWLTWDGRRWAVDQTAEAARRVKEAQAAFFRQVAADLDALGDVGGDEGRKHKLAELTALLRHALKWEDERRLVACLNQMKSEPDVPILPAQLDADPYLFNVLNGTIDLRTGQLREHRREDYLSKLAPVEYDPQARCPLWGKSLSRWTDSNDDLIEYLRRVVGYSLTANVSEQCMWFHHGTGANGKSTFLQTLLAMLGDFGMQAVSELLMQRKGESHPTERADLFGKRFVATIETDEGRRIAEALMKQLTGGDRVRARWVFRDFFEFDQTWKIHLAANHKPAVRGTDHAVWRRIKLIPWTVTIADAEKDKHLLDKLKGELPGILRWAVEGCLAWQRYGLGEPEEVTRATDAYRVEQDLLAAFLQECCVVHREARVKSSALLAAFQTWTNDRAVTAVAFARCLEAKGYRKERGTGGFWFWHGIGLPAEEEGYRGDG